MSANVLVGTLGWSFDAWVGTFYPHGTRHAEMLALYARAFPTVEVEATAYGVPAEHLVREWASQVPEEFAFALRVPQQVTHERRLVDTDRLVRRFVDRVAFLGERQGPFVVPLSPAFRPTEGNRAALGTFLADLPESCRWAVEFRHPGWLTSPTLDLLQSRGVSPVLVDGRWVRREMMADLALEPTADFAVIRWIGTAHRFTDTSRPQVERVEDLDFWVELVSTLMTRVSTVYGYFDNQFHGHAPHSARLFQQAMGLEPVGPEALRDQGELL